MSRQFGSDPAARVLAFLTSAGRRLWLSESRLAARSVLWLLASSLLMMAIVHLRIASVPPVLTASTVAVITLVLLWRVTSRRPTPARAAASADRYFGGKQLLTTALQCVAGARDESSPAVAIVLQQAEAAVQDWTGRLTQFGRQGAVPDLVSPGILAAIGLLMLLTLPGMHQQEDVTLPTVRAGAERVMATPGDKADSLPDAQALGDALRRERYADSRGQEDSGGETADRNRVRIDPGASVAAMDKLQLDRRLRDPVSGSDGGGDQAGRGRPGEAEATADSQAIDEFAGRELFAVLGPGTRRAAGGEPGAGYSADASDNPVVSPFAVAPAEAPSALDTNHWTPAQAALVARYLNQSRQ